MASSPYLRGVQRQKKRRTRYLNDPALMSVEIDPPGEKNLTVRAGTNGTRGGKRNCAFGMDWGVALRRGGTIRKASPTLSFIRKRDKDTGGFTRLSRIHEWGG